MLDFYKLDRTVEFKGIQYRIVEILDSEMLLVVPKEQFDKGEFPLQPVVIPGK